MRQLQIWAVHARFTIKKQIEVECARRIEVGPLAPRRSFQALQQSQQFRCRQAGLQRRHGIHIVGTAGLVWRASVQTGQLKVFAALCP